MSEGNLIRVGVDCLLATDDPGNTLAMTRWICFQAGLNVALNLALLVNAAILVTEWKEFRELDWPALSAVMSTPLLVDGRNLLDPEAARSAGFDYEGIGRAQ